MKNLSLKLNESIFLETEEILSQINKKRNKYINEVLKFYNQFQKRRLMRQDLQAVYASSAEVLRELEGWRMMVSCWVEDVETFQFESSAGLRLVTCPARLSYSLLFKPPNIELINESIKLNKKDHQKPSTVNPGTSALTSMIMSVLMTSRKSPSVRIVTGMVKITKIGLKRMLTTASTPATTSAVQKPSTWAPGKM
ncbi:hypothetical protein BFP72_03410 [Reichenbachiella sp. 5M10]|nr:hypothetical protein BFP72_03410 [Reichenbachiella sp. 5M10]